MKPNSPRFGGRKPVLFEQDNFGPALIRDRDRKSLVITVDIHGNIDIYRPIIVKEPTFLQFSIMAAIRRICMPVSAPAANEPAFKSRRVTKPSTK